MVGILIVIVSCGLLWTPPDLLWAYLGILFILPFFLGGKWGGRTRGKEARRRADITKPLGGFQPPSDTMLWGSWATV